MKKNRYNHKKYQRIEINKGIITFSLILSIGISSFVMKKSTERVKLADGLPSSITMIDNDYTVYIDDKKISEKKLDNSSTTKARTCMSLVDLSDAINLDKKSKIKKIINDIDMDDLGYLCDITDSVDLYDEIKESCHNFWYDDYDKIVDKVNNWLLYHGYETMSEYAEQSIRDFIRNYEPYNTPLEFDVYDKDTGDLKLDDCFYNKDNNLEIISSNNNHYKFDDNSILNAYVTMQYENSQKNKGHTGYNNSRNEYLSNAYEIISSFNYYYKDLDINVEYNGKIEDNNQSTYNYVFRPDDTLDVIIKRFNTDENRLLSLNKDKNLYNLTTGDIVVVPYEFGLDNQNIEQYTVVDDDTVYKIINRYGVSMTDFENANPQIANFDKIVVGEKLNIPITDNPVYTTEVGEVLTEEETKEYELGENEVSHIPVENAKKNLYTIGDEISKNGYARGIDVSEFQGNIDWNKLVIDRHISFAILRMYSIDRNDKFYLDNKFEQNYKACAELGIPVGVYVFIHLLDDEDKMNAEVDTIIKTLDEFRSKYGADIQLPIYIDYELKAQVNNSKKSGESMIKALNKLEKAGYYVGVYSSKAYKEKLDKEVPEIKNYDSWVARYKSEDSSAVVANGKQLDENIVPTFGKNTYNGKAGMVQNYDNVQTNSVDSSGLDIDFMYVDYPNIINKMNLRR